MYLSLKACSVATAYKALSLEIGSIVTICIMYCHGRHAICLLHNVLLLEARSTVIA